jgi:pullulanase
MTRHGSTVTGHLDIADLEHPSGLRTVRVWLPPGHDAADPLLPVLYMFDGQNLFDRATSRYGMEWGIDEALTALSSADPRRAAVVVGVDSAPDPLTRYCEYSLTDWNYPGGQEGESGTPIAAQALQTVEFMLGTVMPWVQGRYRVSGVRGRVAVGGSSMGGCMALILGALRPDRFGSVLAWSPAALDHPMRAASLRDFLAAVPPGPPQRVYVDMGTAERLDYCPDSADLVAALDPLVAALHAGGTREVVRAVAPGATHDERAWGSRFPAAYLWALHGGPPPDVSG